MAAETSLSSSNQASTACQSTWTSPANGPLSKLSVFGRSKTEGSTSSTGR